MLARYTGVKGVWFAYPIAEFVATAIFLPLSMRVFKKEFNKKREQMQARREAEAAAEGAVIKQTPSDAPPANDTF